VAEELLPTLKNRIFPWVVLEEYNAAHRVGNDCQPMKEQVWHDLGWVKVANGVRYLKTLLERREAKLSVVLGDKERDSLRKRLGAKPLGELSVQGTVMLLNGRERLPGIEVTMTAHAAGDTFQAVTGPLGTFELLGLPLLPFQVEVPSHPEYRVLPVTTVKPNTELLMLHLYLALPSLSEAEVLKLMDQAQVDLRADVEAALELAGNAEEQVAALQREQGELRQLLDLLSTTQTQAPSEALDRTLNEQARRLDTVEQQLRLLDKLPDLDPQQVLEDALAPIQATWGTQGARGSTGGPGGEGRGRGRDRSLDSAYRDPDCGAGSAGCPACFRPGDPGQKSRRSIRD